MDGSRSFARFNIAAAILSSMQLPNQVFDMHDNKHAIRKLLLNINTDIDTQKQEMPMHRQCKDLGYNGIIICETSVMIMPMLLFRYFDTFVNSCRITLHTHTQPFVHVVKQSKSFDSMAYHCYTVCTSASTFRKR